MISVNNCPSSVTQSSRHQSAVKWCPPRHSLCPVQPFVRVASRSSQPSFRYSNGTRLDNCRRVPSLLRKKSTAAKHLLFSASHEPLPQSPSTDILEHYWNVEKIATEQTQNMVLSTYDKEALQILQDTCLRNVERYEIGLPWKRNTPLTNNYFAALGQLHSLEKRFREHPKKKVKFDDTLQ